MPWILDGQTMPADWVPAQEPGGWWSAPSAPPTPGVAPGASLVGHDLLKTTAPYAPVTTLTDPQYLPSPLGGLVQGNVPVALEPPATNVKTGPVTLGGAAPILSTTPEAHLWDSGYEIRRPGLDGAAWTLTDRDGQAVPAADVAGILTAHGFDPATAISLPAAGSDVVAPQSAAPMTPLVPGGTGGTLSPGIPQAEVPVGIVEGVSPLDTAYKEALAAIEAAGGANSAGAPVTGPTATGTGTSTGTSPTAASTPTTPPPLGIPWVVWALAGVGAYFAVRGGPGERK